MRPLCLQTTSVFSPSCSVRLTVLYLILVGTVMAVSAENAQSADWLQLRGDRHMIGHSSGRGQMRESPAEAWNFDIAVWEGYMSIQPSTGLSSFELPFPYQKDPGYLGARGRDWGIGPQRFDLHGDGIFTDMPINHRFKVARILPDLVGLQRFEMGDSFDDGGAGEQRGWLTTYDGSESRVVWKTETFSDTWAPNVLVVDADADGQLDIAVATHYRILVFDGATGETKMQLQYHNFRNYGWFGAANIDSDPYPEFAIIADFSMHAEVIDNDGQRLSLKWMREIQPDPSQSSKIVRAGPLNLLDIDGDGGRDLVYNLYNGGEDNQWHLVVVDALTGITRHDYTQRYLHGMSDLDGDGQVELMVSHTTGEALPSYAPLEVWTLDHNGPNIRWAQERGRFSTHLREELPSNISTGAADGLRTVTTGDVDRDGQHEFFVVEPEGQREIMKTITLGNGKPHQLWSVRGPAGGSLQAIRVAEVEDTSRTLVHLKAPGASAQIVLEDGRSTLHQWSRSATTPAGVPVVADLDGDGSTEVVVQTGGREIVCLEPPGPYSDGPTVRWRMQGYGQTNNAPKHWGIVAADLDIDGKFELLFAQETADGHAGLAAVDASGQIRWRHRFEGFDGSMPIWNFSGLSYWSAGHYRSMDHMDVFASLRRGKIGSEVGFLLDGRNGNVVWTSSGYRGRSLGGHPSAAGDVDGDGLEEIVLMWPDRLHIVDGLSGEAEVVRQAYGDGMDPLFDSDGFVGYAFPTVVDLFGDPLPELIWGHNGYLNAVLDSGGNTIWQTDYQNNTAVQSLMGVGDADGDGNRELLVPIASGAQLLNPTDGTVLHELNGIGTAHTDVVSADIDGNGRDEFLYGSGTTIFCLGLEEGELRRLWTLDLTARTSDLALADLNGDDVLDLAVTTTDGYLRAYLSVIMTLIAEDSPNVAAQNILRSPYPNPFNHSVAIPFTIESESWVQLEVYDLAGQRLAVLVDDQLASGDHLIHWESNNAASGIYLVLLRSGANTVVQKVVLIQ